MTLKERFMSKVVMIPEHICWEWIGSKDSHGYGKIYNFGKLEGAHRTSYRLFINGALNEMEVCHACDNPGCVNPKHLFLATHKQNMHDRDKKGRLKNGKGEYQLAKTHCPKGHKYSKENTYKYRNGRQCIKCRAYHSKNRTRGL